MAVVAMERIVSVRELQISASIFRCPYCGQSWDRGGHKEGFVKSAASNHVVGCREIVLFYRGYVQGPEWGTVQLIKDAEKLAHWPRWRRQIKALINRRTRAGLTPKNP